MLLALLPEDGLAGRNRLARAVAAADPPRTADDDEELCDNSRMPPDDTARTDLDHHRVRLGWEPPHTRAHAARSRHRPLAGELDASQTRSITDAIAWPKPMHIVATP